MYLGRQDYRTVLALQQRIFDAKVVQAKLNRGLPATGRSSCDSTTAAGTPIPNVVLAVEHSPNVITMGKRDTSGGLISQPAGGPETEVVRTKRGGGLTWHGHGQVTVYPILDVQCLWRASSDPNKGKSPLTWYSTVLEETMIRTAADYGVAGERGAVGVWVRQSADHKDEASESPSNSSIREPTKTFGESSRYADSTTKAEDTRKLGAVGLSVSNWVSMHGIGFNVSNDLAQFDQLVMCELPGKKATNLIREIREDKKRRQHTSVSTDNNNSQPGLPEVAGKLVYHLHQALQQPPTSLSKRGCSKLEWCSTQAFEKEILAMI